MRKKLAMVVGVTALAVLASLSTPASSQAYRCLYGAPLCQHASQCVTYCGTLAFSSCVNGCCACTG